MMTRLVFVTHLPSLVISQTSTTVECLLEMLDISNVTLVVFELSVVGGYTTGEHSERHETVQSVGFVAPLDREKVNDSHDTNHK